MKKRKHNVYVASPRGYFENVLMENKVKFFEFNIITDKKTLISFIKIFFRILRIVKRYKINVIHTSHRWPNFICFFISYLSNVKLVWRDHNILIGKKILTVHKDKVISVSHTCKEHLINYFHIPEKKIKVIRFALNPLRLPSKKEIDIFLKEINLTSDAKIICTIARLSEQKGHIYLLKAIPKVLSHISNTHFVLAGDGDLKGELIKLAHNLNIHKNIHFLGQREDVQTILGASKVMVLPSLWEGLPLVIQEAFLSKRPAIATNVGGVKELVFDSKTGFLVKPKNSEELSSTIIKILSDDKERKKMGESAYRWVKQNFSFNKMIAEFESVYEEAMYGQ